MTKFIILLTLCFLSHSAELIRGDDLVSVVAVFRHGDRTPTDFPPTDKYQNMSYWPTEPGELTNIGKREHYQVGIWLRQRYSDFLPTAYHPDDIYVRASNTDRCLMSAEANLAGLYPPKGNQTWNPSLKWMPIPVHTVPSEEDNLLKMGKACPNMEPKYKALLENDYFKELDKNNNDLYKFLSSNLGLNITHFSQIEPAYDTMTVELIYNLAQPDWTKTKWGDDKHNVFPDEMKKWSDLSYRTPTYNEELSRLGTGRFFDALASHFDEASARKKENLLANKMAMYFGHKSTICDLTHVLGAFRLASYASSLLFELRHKSDPDLYYVNLNYVDNLKPEKLTIQGCAEDCALQKFLEILEPIRMNETVWKKECLTGGASRLVNTMIPTIMALILYLNIM